MNKAKFAEYADIKNQIKDLTAKAKVIEEEVVSEMDNEEIDTVKSEIGTFYFTYRKKYFYPKYVVEAENTYKELKKKSEDLGEAEFETTKSLTFRGASIEELNKEGK